MSLIPSSATTTQALYNSTNNYNINHLNLQSINNFQLRLSALPDKEKKAFIKQFRFNRRLNAEKSNQKLNNSHLMMDMPTPPTTTPSTSTTQISNQSNDIDDEMASLHNKNQSSLKIFRKQHTNDQQQSADSAATATTIKKKSLGSKIDDYIYEEHQKKKKLKRTMSNQISQSSSSTEQNIIESTPPVQHHTLPIQHYVFTGWDDYFERYHKISTNQSFLRIKTTTTNDNNSGDFMGNINENDSTTTSSVNYGKSERLKFKVNPLSCLINYFSFFFQ